MKNNLRVKIGQLTLKNPVLVASGTFGYGEEFRDFISLKKLGAIVTKTITLNPRKGNPVPRTCETPSGMLNSIGLENPGLNKFVSEKLPALKRIGVPIIVSIASESDAQEFVLLVKRLDKIRQVAAIEMNISCPNIVRSKVKGQRLKVESQRSKLISQDPSATYDLVKAVRKITKKTLITKLSPNVTDITEIAQAVENAGSDAISLVNTFMGLSIDVEEREPKLASITGGLSGPAIRPLALRIVWEVYQKIKIPIIGMGGIMDTRSALEFIIAGASAVSIGTANFINPKASVEIVAGIKKYLQEQKIKSIKTLTGSMKI